MTKENNDPDPLSFSELGLSPKVLQAIATIGYEKPTPIQARAIPHVLQRKDVLGIAQTGTGKTASFVLPMLTLLEKGRARARMPRTLILEPTWELAKQVADNFAQYGINHRLNVALLIGGGSFGEQERKLERGADILIATPGRLLDHFERGKLLLTALEILVIDEADRMLDIGFIPDIERICKNIPFTRQTLFFSATMLPEIAKLTEQFLHSPVCIEATQVSSSAHTITQKFIKFQAKPWEKRAMLRYLLTEEAETLKNAIIFCNRKRDVIELSASLIRHNFNAGALHGDMDQRARTEMLTAFKKGDLKLLVASDVAARGLDIPDVSHVFNFDVPNHSENYIHRIGRTGRAGKQGKAFTIVSKNDLKYVDSIQKMNGEPIEWIPQEEMQLFNNSSQEMNHAPKKQSDQNKLSLPSSGTSPNSPILESFPDKSPKRVIDKASTHKKHKTNKLRPLKEGDSIGFGNDIPAFMLIPIHILGKNKE